MLVKQIIACFRKKQIYCNKLKPLCVMLAKFEEHSSIGSAVIFDWSWVPSEKIKLQYLQKYESISVTLWEVASPGEVQLVHQTWRFYSQWLRRYQGWNLVIFKTLGFWKRDDLKAEFLVGNSNFNKYFPVKIWNWYLT